MKRTAEKKPPAADIRRIEKRIEELFALAPDPGGGARRLAYSPEEARAMLIVVEWIESAGLSPRLDRFGNLWGVPPGDGPFVTSGSHVDTVPNGGRHDGALGTVLALEAVRVLDGPFGVLVCAGEEAPRFGAGTLGSRQLTGKLSDEDLSSMRDANGLTALDARSAFLDALSEIPHVEDPLSRVVAHVEFHIEQRRDLVGASAGGASIGIATAVAGPARYRMTFSGETGHSGETRMADRSDALCAAADAVLIVERLSRKAANTVATVGTMKVAPNSLTAIPDRVELGLDARGSDLEERDDLVTEVVRASTGCAKRRGVDFEIEKLSASDPTRLDESLVALSEAVAEREGIAAARCVSRAGHDAQHIAFRVPAALLFVASANGVSHAPDEAVEGEDLENAARLLPELMRELNEKYGGGKP